MADSLRLQILLDMQTRFAAIEPPPTPPPVPDPSDWPFKFSSVELGPLVPENNRKRYSLGIVPGRERYSHLFPYIVCDQLINIEFRVTQNVGDDTPQTMAERCLTVVKNCVLRNKTWGGLAIDTQLVDSDVDLVSFGDKSIVGVLSVAVKYRHSQSDVRDPNPSL